MTDALACLLPTLPTREHCVLNASANNLVRKVWFASTVVFGLSSTVLSGAGPFRARTQHRQARWRARHVRHPLRVPARGAGPRERHLVPRPLWLRLAEFMNVFSALQWWGQVAVVRWSCNISCIGTAICRLGSVARVPLFLQALSAFYLQTLVFNAKSIFRKHTRWGSRYEYAPLNHLQPNERLETRFLSVAPE